MKVKKFFILGILIIFGLSTLNHFLFKWSNYSSFFAFIAPINESLFQHAKMFFYPIVLYYFGLYILFSKKYQLHYKTWFFLPILVFLITFVTVFGSYYFFFYIFSLESMWIDIGSLFLGLTFGNLLAYRLYVKESAFLLSPSICFFTIFCLSIIFTSWTTKPPREEFFYDFKNETYQRSYD